MAGNNIQADANGDILVEFDYNNIIVVDPNKTIDKFGNISERLVDHESLVMYANLEAELLPRTKLSVGGFSQDRIRTISVAKINFLKPNQDNYLTSGYYDTLTGLNSLNMKGENQTKEVWIKEGNQAYSVNTVRNPNDVIDNGLLGITDIRITTDSSFVPSVTMELEDIQGKVLFELGNNSPYAAFFNLPYPQFFLTIKGYYGQAIRYQLNLETFNCRFNTSSGNYQVSLQFRGYKFNILNEISIGHLLALPHMYGKTFTITSTPEQTQSNNSDAQLQSNKENTNLGNPTNSSSSLVTQITSERGYQKIREVYSEYKSKGLIPTDFPEYTLVQLMNSLELFETFITDTYPKVNIEPLTNIRDYKDNLKALYERVIGGQTSWFNKYLDNRPLILNDNTSIYAFKRNLSPGEIQSALSELQNTILTYNKLLNENTTLGERGVAPIKNNISFKMLEISQTLADTSWRETTVRLTGISNPEDLDIEKIKRTYNDLYSNTIETNALNEVKVSQTPFFVFEGRGRFNEEVNTMESEANRKLSEYESALSADLANRLQDSGTGIGFKPTVRNIVAVIMASTEAFIRLMDEVHQKAWDVKYDPVRKNAILNNINSAPSSDTQDDFKITSEAQNENQGLKTAEIPVYPWPQFFVESPEDKKGRFQLKYIADPSVVNLTKGYLYEKWPEVEFVEEYIKGQAFRFKVPQAPPPLENQNSTNQININPIEYPQNGMSYINKEELRFFYEIWERQFLTAHYSGLNRASGNEFQNLIKLNVETEVKNIMNSLGISNPYINWKLKNIVLNSQNYIQFLEESSNGGTGRSYQDFIRDFFVTPYIRTITQNPFAILNANDLGKLPQFTPQSGALDLLAKSSSNNPILVDTVPFRNPSWVQNNMAGSSTSSGNEVYNTNKTYKVFGARNILANFTDVYNYDINRPVTNFSYLNVGKAPTNALTNQELFDYFNLRKTNEIPNFSFIDPVTFSTINLNLPNAGPKNLIPTEGYTQAQSPTNSIPFETTTSMLNTPYFINAILNGVTQQRKGNLTPYIQAAYLFLNSLPLASLKEKYKSNVNNVEQELDYIASVFKKFGAIHKIPYAWVLKYGSIWYRYKTWKESNIDILDECWKDFDYIGNYSPIEKNSAQVYTFDYVQRDINISLQTQTSTNISLNVGFYPKVITDFNYFYNGFDVFKDYTSTEAQACVDLGMRLYNYTDSNIDGGYLSSDGRTFQEITYTLLLPEFSLLDAANICNPVTNAKDVDYYIVPSFGTKTNQTKTACFVNNVAVTDVVSNPSIFNGTVRTLWGASNFGFFNNEPIVKPKPDSYINSFTSGATQVPFRFLTTDSYSKIEEIFAVFDKKSLDLFELEFLNFCKAQGNTSTTIPFVSFNQSTVDLNMNFRNFQSLFKSIMTVPSQNIQGANQDDNQYFTNIANVQMSVFANSIKSFLQYDVIIKNGNPSFYNRRVWDSYRSLNSPVQFVTNPINFGTYVAGSLPTKNGITTLQESQLRNPKAWTALELEVGFSTISGFTYTNQGSYFTDFFVDNNIEFSVDNITLLAPIIRMYATYKSLLPELTQGGFQEQMTFYLNNTTNLQNNFLNDILSILRRDLSEQSQLPERTITSAFDSELSKVEYYEIFKALNDKWISGDDFTQKTLFEDFLFMDRASRNIGDTILIDIFDLKSVLSEKSLNMAMSVQTFINSILIKNNFVVMNLPAYVNFYNVEDIDGINLPRPEGSLEMANSLWGTFLNVDYRKSAPKLVSFFVGKPSEYLNLPKGNFRYRDDAFDMRRASENPLIEDQNTKNDWALSNKCVGFNVDIGTRNQNIFYSFSVAQDSGVATSESINTTINLVNNSTGRNTATQNVGLYNLYKNRSYQCQVVAMGNALIQPTMYFNLRHVPMFNGPYMILSVEHTINAGNFQTSFTGVRQGIFDLPAIDNFLQQINKNLLTNIEKIVKVQKTAPPQNNTSDNTKSQNLIQNAQGTKAAPNSCAVRLLPLYTTLQYTPKEAVLSGVTPENFSEILKRKIPQDFRLRTAIFAICYLRTFKKSSNTGVGTFDAFDNNLATITLDNDLTPTETFFERTYSCVNLKTNDPYPIANFSSIDRFVDFMIARLTPNIGRIVELTLEKYYVCYWPQTNISEEYFDANRLEFKSVNDKLQEGYQEARRVGLITQEEAVSLRGELPASNPVNTPTPSRTVQNQLCPPPVINNFFPTGVTRTDIVQVNGIYLLDVTGITIQNTVISGNSITIFNDNTLRFEVPNIQGTEPITTRLILGSKEGQTESSQLIKYDPDGIPKGQSASSG